MDAKTYPLAEILRPERRYIIPTFQRDYEWTADGQWRLLFEDLASTADRLLEVRTGSGTGAREQDLPPHFLGAVVCAAMPFSTGGVPLRSVIDGQQRLTTVQLLLRGLADALDENGSQRLRSVRRMLFNPDDVVEAPEEVYKLWPRRRDRDVWPVAMADEPPTYGPGGHLYLQARQFFAGECRAYVSSDDGSTVDTDRLHALVDAVSDLFKLVVIDLDDNDDAQVIFEVLNGRQTPLSAIDLVKNLLFLRSELADDDVEELYDTYWAQFDDPWWTTEVGRGHAQRGRRDVLLSAWLTAAIGKEANVGHLYREARAYLDQGPPTEEILVDISQFAGAYRDIYEPPEGEDPLIVEAYRRLVTLDITTAIPVLAWLRTLDGSVLNADAHVRAVRAVESWAVRRVIVGSQTRGYGTHLARVLSLAKRGLGNGAAVDATIVAALQEGQAGWPTDDQVDEAVLTRRFYGPVTQARIRLLLAGIDQKLRRMNTHEPPATIEYDRLQIEHVMPRSWQQHWPLVDTDGNTVPPDGEDPAWVRMSAERSQKVDRLGNLTLVTGTFNRALSNRGWAVKRPEFANQHTLVVNKYLAVVDDWSEATIDARAAVLAFTARAVWPSPEALTSEV